MTNDEIKQFQDTILQTIMPIASKMTMQQIHDIIKSVPDIDDKFKNMLLEQVLIMKHNKNN
jgi:hypothetical protein